MNVKTYTWAKYLATIASILLLIDPLLVVLKVAKTNFFLTNWTLVLQVTVPLYVGAVVFLGLYFWLRLHLIKKSNYLYTKKDKFYLTLSFSLYGLAILMVGLDLIVGLINQDKNSVLAYTIFGISYFCTAAGLIGGAICETLSRVQEQIQLYQDQEKRINAAKKNKRQELLNDEVSEGEIEAMVKANRTPDAQNLLQKKPSKKSNAIDKTPTSNGYNPFLDEKLNQKLGEETSQTESDKSGETDAKL